LDSQYLTKDKECTDGLAQGIEEIGIRGIIGRCSADGAPTPQEFWEPVDVAIREACRVIETYHEKADGRVTVRVEASNEATASKEMVMAMANLARSYHIGFSMHAAETPWRVEGCRQKYGYPSVEWLWNLGILGPDVLLAHCIWLNDMELNLLSATGTNVVHNPVANQYMGDGVAPITKMLDRGITVALGTDGAASNNGQDMFEAMKAAALLQKVSQHNPRAINCQKILEMATIDAAKAIGMADKLGSLEAGKFADIVLIDLAAPFLVPSVNAISNLIYATSTKAVDLVLVNGQVVFKDGEIITLDQKELIRKCNNTAQGLLKEVNNEMKLFGMWKIL